MWLRWSPPDNESNDTVVVGFKVTASAPGVEAQVSEVAPVRCPTWPDYFCHRLRSLIPDTEYDIQVRTLAKSYAGIMYEKPFNREFVPF